MRPLTASEADRVASAIVADRLSDLPASLLTRAGLAASAYLEDPDGVARQEGLQAFASLTAHHHTVRHELAPLLRAWHDDGIEALVFKGFALAEWAYEQPAERLYGDVDVLLDPADVPRAQAVARREGWQLPWTRPPGSFGHEAFEAVSPSGVTQVDVHVLAVHSASPFDAAQRRITAAVRHDAGTRSLDGVPVRVPRPEDAAVVGLALNRFWSPDELTLKPHDYHDLRTLARRSGLDAAAFAARSRELGCGRTWRLFVSRCDPWRCRLVLRRPDLPTRQAYVAQIALERPHPQVEDLLVRAFGAVRRGGRRRPG